MPTYADYVAACQLKRILPVYRERTFQALIAVGFNPITSEWSK